MANRPFGHQESASRIDLVHQIEPLHVDVGDGRELNGAGIVDDDIDAAEFCRGLVQRVAHHGLVADVDDEGQRLAASALDLFGGGIDGAGKFWMRLRCLRGDRDIGAVALGAQRNRQPDAARRAGDEQSLAGKRHARPHFLRERKAAKAARASSDRKRSLKCIASVSTRSTIASRWPRISLRATATAPGGSAAISRAALSAACSTSAASTTLLMRPAALASAADSGRPMTRSSKARTCPISIGASRLDAASGISPRFTNGVANTVPAAATT